MGFKFKNSLLRKFGRRGYSLLLMGTIWIAGGYGQLTSNVVIVGAPHSLLPNWLQAILWFISGFIAIVCAFHKGRDDIGFATLTVLPTLYVVSHVWAWIMFLIPGEPDGSARGWFSAFFYLAMVLWVSIVSGWQEPYRKKLPE